MELKKEWNFDEVIDRRNTGSMKWEPSVLKNYTTHFLILLMVYITGRHPLSISITTIHLQQAIRRIGNLPIV